MTDPTPPRAPDAVPEAVLAAIDLYRRSCLYFRPDNARTIAATYGSPLSSRKELEAAIARALREATAERDQEIARLTAELAAAKADTARLNAEIAAMRRALDIWRCGHVVSPDALRVITDAARAAGEREG